MTTIIIQPHSDDLAFSIGGMLAGMYFLDVRAITVFSNSLHDNTHKYTDTTTTRRLEDARFFQEVGINNIDLAFYDAPLRGYTNTTIYQEGGEHDRDFREIKTRIRENIPPKSTVIVPMGLGNHIDHLIVKDAFKDYKRVMYYEDFPYNLLDPADSDSYMKVSSYYLDNYTLAKKISNIKIYETQAYPDLVPSVSTIRSERLWVKI